MAEPVGPNFRIPGDMVRAGEVAVHAAQMARRGEWNISISEPRKRTRALTVRLATDKLDAVTAGEYILPGGSVSSAQTPIFQSSALTGTQILDLLLGLKSTRELMGQCKNRAHVCTGVYMLLPKIKSHVLNKKSRKGEIGNKTEEGKQSFKKDRRKPSGMGAADA